MLSQGSNMGVSRSLVHNSQMLEATPKHVSLLNGQTAHVHTWKATWCTQQAINKKINTQHVERTQGSLSPRGANWPMLTVAVGIQHVKTGNGGAV